MGQNLLPKRFTGKGEEYYFLERTGLWVPWGTGRMVPGQDSWVLEPTVCFSNLLCDPRQIPEPL